MPTRFVPFLLFASLLGVGHSADPLVIFKDRLHLRGGGEAAADLPEWSDFPATCEAGGKHVFAFETTTPNTTEMWTLWLDQINVRGRWNINLNGERLGTLVKDEQAQRAAWPIPPLMVKAGKNELTIGYEAGQPNTDDIYLGHLAIDRQFPANSAGAHSVKVVVNDGAMPCRITVSTADGRLVTTGNLTTKTSAVRPGVIYTLDGQAEIGLPELGEALTITASRGFEYSIDRATLDADPERWPETVALTIRKEVDFPGEAIDSNVHTRSYSRHGDCHLHERIITMAGEGLQVGASTEHNRNIDYSRIVNLMNAGTFIRTLVGNEYTTRSGNFSLLGVDPGVAPPGYIGASWAGIMEGCRMSKAPVVILNHPHETYNGVRPFDPKRHDSERGVAKDGRAYFFNGVEVVTSSAPRTDPFQGMHDWFGLLNAGLRVGAVGSSDAHDVSHTIVGQARTYIRGKFQVDAFAEALTKGQTHLAYGLLAELKLEDGMPVVTVHKPSWIEHDKTTLYRNGKEIPLDQAVAPLTEGDWLVAVAEGPGVTAPHWPFARPEQPDGPVFKPRAIGISNLVRAENESADSIAPPATP